MKIKEWFSSKSMNPPKNRTEEFAKYVINNNTEWLDYRLFSKLYYDLNAHKKLAVMKENGFVFEERNLEFTSEYGFKSQYKQFRLKTNKLIAIDMYNKLTNREK